MIRREAVLGKLTAVAVVVALAAVPASAITLTPISTPFNSPIGIDYHQPTNSVVISANYNSGGFPNNFERILQDGTHVPFSSVAGYTDEIKIATARSGNPFIASGTLFVGNGNDGEIMKITPNGSSASLYTSLPGGGNGLFRGSLYVDRTGVYNYDLIAVTTAGQVWRVDSTGTPTFIANVQTHLEGLLVVPNDVSKYGPLAGKIIAGAEGQGLMYAFDASGAFNTYALGVNIEDIDLIEPGANFFGVNFGTNRILGAPASEFSGMVGDILLTQEFGGASGLFRMYWNGSTLAADPLTLSAGSFRPGQWEHVTFAPAGIKEIPPVPEPATMALSALGLGALGSLRRRKRQQ